ncbi:hypothetical protein EVAR_39388_1 [Eumeta japonica]|uniref:Uncharacterized protein n=1 Tax=Eumeta variegata TaxID=151549 RepID=A0A4C1ZB83_EUMVA|nr:hypothetical protein EVAR_39388_1 [Eumeta japonica]
MVRKKSLDSRLENEQIVKRTGVTLREHPGSVAGRSGCTELLATLELHRKECCSSRHVTYGEIRMWSRRKNTKPGSEPFFCRGEQSLGRALRPRVGAPRRPPPRRGPAGHASQNFSELTPLIYASPPPAKISYEFFHPLDRPATPPTTAPTLFLLAISVPAPLLIPILLRLRFCFCSKYIGNSRALSSAFMFYIDLERYRLLSGSRSCSRVHPRRSYILTPKTHRELSKKQSIDQLTLGMKRHRKPLCITGLVSGRSVLTDKFKESSPKSVVVPQNIGAVRELIINFRNHRRKAILLLHVPGGGRGGAASGSAHGARAGLSPRGPALLFRRP